MKVPPSTGTSQGDVGPHSSWVTSALAGIRNELRLYLRTALAVSLRPAAFAAEWREGTRDALNPLAFLATALAFSSPPTLAVSHFAGLQEQGGSLWDAFLADQVAPYVQYVLLGIFAHGFLRLLGGSQRLLATVAIALFVAGGPAMAIDLLTLPLDVTLGHVAASAESASNFALQVLTVASIAGANLAFFVIFALGLAGLHRLRWWRPALALLAAYLLLMVLRILFFKLWVPS
jgi:hypothetical protein